MSTIEKTKPPKLKLPGLIAAIAISTAFILISGWIKSQTSNSSDPLRNGILVAISNSLSSLAGLLILTILLSTLLPDAIKETIRAVRLNAV